ncbi:MAG: lamin tail domain-containing protein [Candidatus Nanohalobium sp.]
MVKARQAAVLSATFVILLSVPVASGHVEISEENQDGFTAVINGKFSDSFKFISEDGEETVKLEGTDSSYSRTESSSERIKKLETPEGTLKTVRSNTTDIKIVKTPYGTLKKGVKNGRKVSSFEGLNRSRTQKAMNKLEDKMALRGREASVKKRSAVQKALPDLELSVKEGDREHINITNSEGEDVDLTGWKVENSRGDSFRLNHVLEPGESLSVYSDDQENVSEPAVVDSGLEIYSGSWEVLLYTDSGYPAASKALN